MHDGHRLRPLNCTCISDANAVLPPNDAANVQSASGAAEPEHDATRTAGYGDATSR